MSVFEEEPPNLTLEEKAEWLAKQCAHPQRGWLLYNTLRVLLMSQGASDISIGVSTDMNYSSCLVACGTQHVTEFSLDPWDYRSAKDVFLWILTITDEQHKSTSQ